MSYLAFQYSEALFSLALDEKKLDKVLSDFELFTSSLDEEIYTFLNHPKITKNDKKEIVSKAISNSLLKNFINVLIDNSRIDLLEDTLSEFKKLFDNQHKVLKVTVYSNKVLSDKQKANLIESLETKNNRKVELNNVVDSKIVGGLRLEYEGMVLDDTINNYLHNLKTNLTK
jgi:F-type H+-transporting ATPase subunit delta